MAYISNKEKVDKFIESYILTSIKKKDLDYYKVLDLLQRVNKVSKNVALEVLQGFIDTGKLKEIRVLTVQDEVIPDLLDELVQEEKKIEEELNGLTKE